MTFAFFIPMFWIGYALGVLTLPALGFIIWLLWG